MTKLESSSRTILGARRGFDQFFLGPFTRVRCITEKPLPSVRCSPVESAAVAD